MRARGDERRAMRWLLRGIVVSLLATAGCATGSGGAQDGGSPPRDSGMADAAPSDSGVRDAGPDAGPVDAGPVDAFVPLDSGSDAGTDSGMPACPPTSANLAIVELMIATESGAEDRGEWVELVNAGTCPIDLGGVVVVSPDIGGTEMTYTIPAGHVLAPGARFVLAQSANASENRSLVFDVAYGASGIVLDNGSDWVELRVDGAPIDRASWTSTGVVTRYSRMFPDGRPISENGTTGAWCLSSADYSNISGVRYYGTPRRPNGTCP